jgi:hypothetical protein
MLEHLANVWGRRNGQVAIEWAESLDGSDRRRALHSALHGWSEEDPAGAAQYVAELPTSEQNLHLVHEMAIVGLRATELRRWNGERLKRMPRYAAGRWVGS